MASKNTSPNPIEAINKELSEIERLLADAITQGQVQSTTPGTSGNPKDKVMRAETKVNSVLTNRNLEIYQFEKLVAIYQMAKQQIEGQRPNGTVTPKDWEKTIESRAQELKAKKAVIDKEKFDLTKALEIEKQKAKDSQPEVDKAKKIWDNVKEIRNHYKKKISGIAKALKKVEKIKSNYPDADKLTLKELREKIQHERDAKDTTLQQKRQELKDMEKDPKFRGPQLQLEISELEREIREGHVSIFTARKQSAKLARLKRKLEPYTKLKEEIAGLESEIKTLDEHLCAIDTVHSGIKAIVNDVVTNSDVEQETKDYMSRCLPELNNNYECIELQILLAGDMADSKLAITARREYKAYNKAMTKIGAFEAMQTSTTQATPVTQQSQTTGGVRNVSTQTVAGKGKNTDQKNKDKKSKKGLKGKKNKDKKSKNKGKNEVSELGWELEIMTEEQKRKAAAAYYRKQGNWFTKLFANGKAKTEKGRKKWEEYYASQHKTEDTSNYKQVQQDATNAWRKKLLHTVAGKANSASGYELTDDEREDLYK